MKWGARWFLCVCCVCMHCVHAHCAAVWLLISLVPQLTCLCRCTASTVDADCPSQNQVWALVWMWGCLLPICSGAVTLSRDTLLSRSLMVMDGHDVLFGHTCTVMSVRYVTWYVTYCVM